MSEIPISLIVCQKYYYLIKFIMEIIVKDRKLKEQQHIKFKQASKICQKLED